MSSSLITFPTISIRDPWVWVMVVVVLFVVAFLISPATFRNILGRFGNIGGLFGKLGGILYQILNQVWGVWCELSFIPWKFVDTSRALFFSTTFGVLAFGTLHIFIDSPAVAESVASRIPSLLPWLLFVRKFLEEAKPWPDIVLVVLAIVALWHTLIEFRHSLKREEVSEVLGDLVIEFHDLLRQTPNPSQADKDAYLQKLMSQTQKLLVGKSRRKIFVSIMSEETAKDANNNEVKTGYLKLAPIPVGTQLDTSLRLRVVSEANETDFHGEGAAGSAFCLQCPVYIPRVLFQVGIRLDLVKSLGTTYAKSKDPVQLRSILSVPVVVLQQPMQGAGTGAPIAAQAGVKTPTPTSHSVAVITAASTSLLTAFSRDDMRILKLVAVFISRLY